MSFSVVVFAFLVLFQFLTTQLQIVQMHSPMFICIVDRWTIKIRENYYVKYFSFGWAIKSVSKIMILGQHWFWSLTQHYKHLNSFVICMITIFQAASGALTLSLVHTFRSNLSFKKGLKNIYMYFVSGNNGNNLQAPFSVLLYIILIIFSQCGSTELPNGSRDQLR